METTQLFALKMRRNDRSMSTPKVSTCNYICIEVFSRNVFLCKMGRLTHVAYRPPAGRGRKRG